MPDCAMSRRQILGSTCSLNTITPCAACKLLRRRCAQEWPFSPYFSPHEPQKFAAVHKVFGASNVSKLLLVITRSIFYVYILLETLESVLVICDNIETYRYSYSGL